MRFGDGKTNQIGLQIVQDVFKLNPDILVDASAGNWENPVDPPAIVEPRLVWEMPLQQMLLMAGQADTDKLMSVAPMAGLLQVAGAQTGSTAYDALIYVNGANTGVAVTFCTCGYIDAELSILGTTINLENATSLLSAEVGFFAALIGDDIEIVRITAISGPTFTIDRGMLDTVPRFHRIGTTIVVYDDYSESDNEPRNSGTTINVQLLTRTSQDILSGTLAPIDILTYAHRIIRPLRPANIVVAGQTDGDVDARGLTEVPTSWVFRNRLTDAYTPARWTDAGQTPESGQTTIIEVWNDAFDVLLATHSGLAGTSFNIPMDSFGEEFVAFLRFGSQRAGYREWQPFDFYIQVDDPPDDILVLDEEYLKLDTAYMVLR